MPTPGSQQQEQCVLGLCTLYKVAGKQSSAGTGAGHTEMNPGLNLLWLRKLSQADSSTMVQVLQMGKKE